MRYREILELLSACGIGAALVAEDGGIMEINGTGSRLLHGEEDLTGRVLDQIAPELCLNDGDCTSYRKIAFNEYLLLQPAPNASDLPARSRLIVFRDANKDVWADMMSVILNRISESIILCDDSGRILMLNDAAVKMDSILTDSVFGKQITSVYDIKSGNHAVPRAIRERRPILNERQNYVTCYGKSVDIVSNSYPIVKSGKGIGGFSVMEDWSKIDELNKRIVDLQGRLVDRSALPRPSNAMTARYRFEDIIHMGGAMGGVVKNCRQAAKTDSSVMIYGETGTGKELFAQSIHNASRRADGPFLAINCAAIPENLLESLLFGTEKGAYTGAEKREGFFEQANGGTLLLDEINSMNINLQSKLLRVLQDGMVRRVGGTSEIHVDVRVLSNTNIPPYQAIEQNKLRRDLFYRLGVVNINIPPLRERKDDIPLLARSFLSHFNSRLLKDVGRVGDAALELFFSYSWPGNVRELQHAIEHAMNVLPDHMSVITPEYLPEHIVLEVNGGPSGGQPAAKAATWDDILHSTERRLLCGALRENHGNFSKAARSLGISRQKLQYQMSKIGLTLEEALRER